MGLRKWLLGTLLLIGVFVGLVYGLPVLAELLVRSAVLVALLALAVLVPLLVFRWL